MRLVEIETLKTAIREVFCKVKAKGDLEIEEEIIHIIDNQPIVDPEIAAKLTKSPARRNSLQSLLKEARAEKKMSQSELGSYICSGNELISRYENGKIEISFEVFVETMHAMDYGVSVEIYDTECIFSIHDAEADALKILLRKARKELELHQYEAEELFLVAKGTFSKYETGRNRIPFHSFLGLMKKMGFEVSVRVWERCKNEKQTAMYLNA